MTSTAHGAASIARLPAPRPALPGFSRLTRLWMWGFFPAFLLHDGEEAFVVVRDGGMRAFGSWESTPQALAAIVAVLTVAFVATVLATRPGATHLHVEVFIALLAAWTMHGVGHLVLGAVQDGYTFGGVTALLGCVAYGGLALTQFRADGVVSARRIGGLALAGLAAVPFLLLAAHMFGRLVT